MRPLLDYARNVHSQYGEDGIIERIFTVVGEESQFCCEFGAWDGIHLSNTRALVERGWRGVFIEPEPSRFADLQRTYPRSSGHVLINAGVDDDRATLGRLLTGHGVTQELDFLSIDIDGLDYDILLALDVAPRVICIEVNAAHDPASSVRLARAVAGGGVGQPLKLFVDAADARGYRLVGYTGNAFFLRADIGHHLELPTLDPVFAWEQHIGRLGKDDRFWLYKMNLGVESPFFAFGNPRLSAKALGLPFELVVRARRARWRAHR